MPKTIFTSIDDNVKFENQTFTEFIDERNITINGSISFYKCKFLNHVIFERITAVEFTFYDCSFDSNLYIGKSNLHSLSFFNCFCVNEIKIFENQSSGLSFRKTDAKIVEIDGNYRSSQFVDSKVDKVTFWDINTDLKQSKLSFLAGNIIKDLRLNCSSCQSEILFASGIYNSTIFEGNYRKQLTFKGDFEIENLHFENAEFYTRIDFEEGHFGYVSFHRSVFHGLIYFNDSHILEPSSRDLKIRDLSLHSSNFDKNVSVQIIQLGTVNISNCTFHEVLNIDNQLTEKGTAPLVIQMDGVNQGTIIFERTFADITISGINTGNITFKELFISHLYINEYQNFGVLSFSKVKDGEYIIIQDSITGKMNFISADINVFKEIIISDSNIDGSDFNIYPKKIRSKSKSVIAGYGIDNRSARIRNLKNVYNQLKRIAKAKGDIDVANQFESLEHKQLLLSKKISFDTFLLLLNFISNNNGKSWVRGVIFTLLVAAVFFYLYTINIGNGNFTIESYKEYVLFISSFPKLELKKYEIQNEYWNIQLIIWLARIFISYGIYQTIAAFRKYGRN